MILSFLWLLFLFLSVLFGILEKHTGEITAALLTGAQEGVELLLSIAGSICLWSAVSKLCERSGMSKALQRPFAGILKRLFPVSWQDEESAHYITGNLLANMMGLGNAATPLGIRAVTRMREISGKDAATPEMCRLIVLNTASVQLLPTTLVALRAGLGCQSPLDVLPAILTSSVISVCFGILFCLSAERLRRV